MVDVINMNKSLFTTLTFVLSCYGTKVRGFIIKQKRALSLLPNRTFQRYSGDFKVYVDECFLEIFLR